jgi:hypothetical protein
VTFDYVLTNTGNVPLGSVVVWDDNGTPGNTGDDFQATYVGGDSNFNELLDTTETWSFAEVRTAIAGQYTNTSTASGLDSISQLVISSDPTSYFVPANADFNSDTNIDAGDYVLWRKNSGITSGASLSQGDANGDGMVDSIDYDAWRSQFTAPTAGGGTGTSTASGAGAELPAPAAALVVVDSTIAKDIAVESASSPADATEARSVASVKDSAFEQLSIGARSPRVSQHSVAAARRVAVREFSRDWTSLLTLLVDHKTGPENGEATHSTAKNSPRNGEKSGIEKGPLGANLALFGLRKAASAGV